MRFYAFAFVLLFTLSSEASKFRELCEWAMTSYKRVQIVLDQPFVRDTEDGDLIFNVKNDNSAFHSNISARETIKEKNIPLFRKHKWLKNYWKYFWLLPDLVWTEHKENGQDLIIGTGNSILGEIEIRLLKNADEFTIEITHKDQAQAHLIRPYIHQSANYVRTWGPNFASNIETPPGAPRTIIYLDTYGGYQANNAFIHRLVEHVMGLEPDQPHSVQ
jgi:hypothetical protein